MIRGTVIGSLWATQKHPLLEGWKLLIVRPDRIYRLGPVDRGPIVALDRVGAGPGDAVLVSLGKAVREDARHRNLPAEAAVVAVLDGWEES